MDWSEPIGCLLFTALLSHAQPFVHLQRPPGFGPELDRSAIALFEGFRSWLANEVGCIGGEKDEKEPIARHAKLERNFFGQWRLKPTLRRRFNDWKLELLGPGMQVLGVDMRGMSYYLYHLRWGYKAGKSLGDYSLIRSSASAHTQLARDCEKLALMAEGYVVRLRDRLAQEAAAPTLNMRDTLSDAEWEKIMAERKRRNRAR